MKQNVSPADKKQAPLVIHIVNQMGYGGVELGIINIVNTMPKERYRHAIISQTGCRKGIVSRLSRPDVKIYTLSKRKGNDPRIFLRMWKILRQLRPAIVHTRNLATQENQVVAWLAGVKTRIHGDHGWDTTPDKILYRAHQLRRMLRPFVKHYIALSQEIGDYLVKKIGVHPDKLSKILNGVDTRKYYPRERAEKDSFSVCTVGGLRPVKDQANLVLAVKKLLEKMPHMHDRIKLSLIGDGPARKELEALIAAGHLENIAEITGFRNDVPDMLHEFDIFVLPSKAEGIPNVILEAMACGLPVIATDVGGNRELLVEGETGFLVPPSDSEALADALQIYIQNPHLMKIHGIAARKRIETYFSLETMASAYMRVYDMLLFRQPQDKQGKAVGRTV